MGSHISDSHQGRSAQKSTTEEKIPSATTSGRTSVGSFRHVVQDSYAWKTQPGSWYEIAIIHGCISEGGFPGR